jgi:N6-L-threonylcarbamoyladenine synthase
MRILGIETSCDETSAAIVTDGGAILSTITKTQLENHLPYGGVVPEISARAHLDLLPKVIEASCLKANLSLQDIDAIAVTAGPGLIGGVMVGVMAAKAMAAALDKPILAINHLEGHALTARLDPGVDFPFLLLLISGGHCQFLEVQNVGKYRLLGTTLDDASGEAFDKVARLLDLDYPGGPLIEKLAKEGDPKRFAFPRPLLHRPNCDFSFAGLKTAVRTQIEHLGQLSDQDKKDIAASFQEAVADCLADRLGYALKMCELKPTAVVVAGGVASNEHLRARLTATCITQGIPFIAPPIWLCTDNAAMIAWAGVEHFRLGHKSPLSFAPRPRWPLVDAQFT